MRSALSTFNEVWQHQFRAGFLTQLAQFKTNSTFLLGCSGGVDSMLLLFLMAEICPERLRVLYVNHQLQVNSDVWGAWVQQQCHQLKVECIIEVVDVAQGNLENQARLARHAAYQQHLKEQDILVLGHHQQDQAETVILRLLSGAGIGGLAAMKQIDQRESYQVWRPMLTLSRERICQWAAQLKLSPIEDPSNQDTDYDRAWSRLSLWPLLQKRFPKMQDAICRSSVLMQDADEILTEVMQQDWQQCGDADVLDLEKVQRLSLARRRQLFSAWMKGEGQYRPAFDMIQRLHEEVVAAKSDAQAALHWASHYYVRYQKKLYRLEKELYLAHQSHQPNRIAQQVVFNVQQSLRLAAGCFAIQAAEMGLSPDLLNQNLHLNDRVGGEKIHLYGRVGAWPLKKAIQDAHIFPWMRHTIQILSRDNVMLGVFTPEGFWLAQSDYCVAGGWVPHFISES